MRLLRIRAECVSHGNVLNAKTEKGLRWINYINGVNAQRGQGNGNATVAFLIEIVKRLGIVISDKFHGSISSDVVRPTQSKDALQRTAISACTRFSEESGISVLNKQALFTGVGMFKRCQRSLTHIPICVRCTGEIPHTERVCSSALNSVQIFEISKWTKVIYSAAIRSSKAKLGNLAFQQ